MTNTVLKTDKYEFTMLQAALTSGVAHKKAVFELYTRRLPEGRNYGIVAGTPRALKAIRDFKFTDKEIEYLEDHLNHETIEYLRNFRFTGTVSGYKEGDYFFPHSPVFTIEGTFGEAVLFETVLLSIFNYDSAVASMASRIRKVAGKTPLQELGARRANEDAAVVAARAAVLAGWDGTSNLLAGERYGVNVFGTSAHAFTLAHEDEVEAFKSQVQSLGVHTTLLVDTYNIAQGIRNAIEAAGVNLGAIRLDSGDPFVEIPAARDLLDDLGAVNTRIVFSGDLDFETVKAITEANLPVDGFGIGSEVVTGGGFPNCGFVYKLVEIEYEDGLMHPVAKNSASKSSVGGKKLAYREFNDDWEVEAEHIFTTTPTAAEIAGLTPLQEVYILQGSLLKMPTLDEGREIHAQNAETLPLEKTVELVIQ